MGYKRIVGAVSGFVVSTVLVACSQSEASNAAEGPAEAFFEFILMLALIAMIMTVVMALILAGGVAAILAGIRRLQGRSQPPPPASVTPARPAETAQGPAGQPHDSPDAPSLPDERQRREQPDTFGIALIVFGAVLVITAGPFVFNADGFSTGVGISVPLPLLILAGVLVVVALRRRRRL